MQAGSAGAGMPGGTPARPFVEARLELAAHNHSILYLKLVSLAVAVRPPHALHYQSPTMFGTRFSIEPAMQ